MGQRPGRRRASVGRLPDRLLPAGRPGSRVAHQSAPAVPHQCRDRMVWSDHSLPIRPLSRARRRSSQSIAGASKFIEQESGPIAALAGLLRDTGYFGRRDKFGNPLLSNVHLELIQYLAQKDEERKDRENEGEMERIMFATNPEWWKQMYMDPAADEKGEVILTPTNKDEF